MDLECRRTDERQHLSGLSFWSSCTVRVPGSAQALVPKGAKGLDSAEAAAIAALNSLPNIKAGEHAGVVLKGPDGKYYATDPVMTAQEDFQLHVPLQKGWSIAGIFHNHPGGDGLAQYFSP